MIRGRHRILPVAIDRAVMLPNDRFDQDQRSQIGQGSTYAQDAVSEYHKSNAGRLSMDRSHTRRSEDPTFPY